MSKEAMMKAAVSRWQENAKATRLDGIKYGWEGCSFCEVYYTNGCRGCPIRNATGQARCAGTPYPDVAKAVREFDLPGAKAASQRMVEFLEGLNSGGGNG